MRFHRFKDLATKKIETLRFTRALLGLSTSTFLHGGGGGGGADRPTPEQSAAHLPEGS